MISILVLVPVVIIVLIFLITAATKAGAAKGGGDEVIKKVYLYLVLFTTLMMSIGGSVAAFMAAADIISPTAYYQSFDEYKRYGAHDKSAIEGEEEVKLSEEELLTRYNDMVATEKERQIVRAKNSLIKSLGWIVIPFPIFIYSQRRLGKKEKE
ncbi:MAG: hypothetical protein PHS83_05865 [Clostridia bacterium]|nr:hypothetical protein [Clostridia bacterium]MDD4146600.1 hypothetical protein [Clostridia bacterium]MDD4666274.1 hypothetical protein [Clostridia bacterium]